MKAKNPALWHNGRMRYFILFLTSISVLFATEREELLDVVSRQWISKGVHTAAELDVAGCLLQGTKSIEQLARNTGTDEDNLYRLMRMLSSAGIFKELPGKNFANTPTSALLAEKHPNSMRSLILFYNGEIGKAFDNLSQSVKQGVPAFELTYQKPLFAYFRDNKAASTLFQSAMKQKSRLIATSCLQSFPFGKFATVYDIGSGSGDFLQTLLTKNPRMRGLFFDKDEVITKTRGALEPFGQRCGLVSGDLFQSVPPDGDAYLLKSVLHDWDDLNAAKILSTCHKAMKPSAKLLIVEPLMAPANEKDYAKCMDVLMMALTGGKERTEEDFRYLLTQAGFKIDSITPTETEFVIIQASRSR
jgi:hypothetical protein